MSVFVGAEDLGRILGIGENSLLAMARERRIPAVVIGRRVLFHPDDVEEALRAEGRALVQDGRHDEGLGLGERLPSAAGTGDGPRHWSAGPNHGRWGT